MSRQLEPGVKIMISVYATVLLFVALAYLTHVLGVWDYYAGHLNGGITVSHLGGVELWGHPGFFGPKVD